MTDYFDQPKPRVNLDFQKIIWIMFRFNNWLNYIIFYKKKLGYNYNIQ